MVRLTSVYIYSVLTAITTWLFLHAQKSYGEGAATFDYGALMSSIYYFKLYYFAFGAYFLSLFLLRKSSYLFFTLLTIITFYYSLKLQLTHFNKISVLMIFVFIMISYYFIYLLKKENQEPYYFTQAKFDNLVRKDLVYPIACQLEFLKDKTKASGSIISWSDAGIYIFNGEGFIALGDTVSITVEKFGRFFQFNGTIISRAQDRRGVGIKLEQGSAEETFGWPDLYKILNDRGLEPAYVI